MIYVNYVNVYRIGVFTANHLSYKVYPVGKESWLNGRNYGINDPLLPSFIKSPNTDICKHIT